jgi:hypothetical protein
MADLSKMSTEELLKMREQVATPSSPARESPPLDIKSMSTEQLLRVREAVAERERPKRSIGSSVMAGAAQGALLGFPDEIEAGAGALFDYVQAKTGQRGDISLRDAYETRLRHSRTNYDEAKADNPKAFIGGAIGGGLATSLLSPVGLAKGATTAQNIGKAAGLGAISGAGTSEAVSYANPEGAKEFGKDVVKGAVIGGVLQGAVSVAGKALSALKPDNLKQLAATKALKASGYMGKDLKNMSEGAKLAAGSELLEKGVVTAGVSLDDVAQRAAAQKDAAGQEIGKALGAVDDLVNQAKTMIDDGLIGGQMPPQGKEALKSYVDKQFQFNMSKIGQTIEKTLIKPNDKNPLLKGELNKLRAIADDFKAAGGLTMREGNVIKGTQGKITNFNSDTVPQGFKKELYSIIREHLDDVVAKTGNLEAAVAQGSGKALGAGGSAATTARNQAVSEAYQGAKKTYGVMKEAQEIAASRLGQTQGNREISLTDTIAGAAGLASGGPQNAILLGGMNKLARQYGDSFLAAGAKRVAEIIEKAPERLGKFGLLLEDAASKGAPALNATHVSLMKDPDYRRILDNFERTRAISRRLGGK